MKGFPAFVLVILGGLAMTSCNLNPNYASNGDGPNFLLITAINGGNELDSDVRFGEQATPPLSFVCQDFASVRVENHAKNPKVGTLDYRGDIVIDRYEVQYSRSDGRGVQGVDVPYTISGNIAAEVIAEQATTVNIEVVRRQAKLEPPLNSLVGGPGPSSGVIIMFAKITLHGRTNAGYAVSAFGILQIDFADFGDKNTACPTTTG
jgi:hypothetical protein